MLQVKFKNYFKISIFSHILRLDLVSAAVSQAYTNSPIFLEEGMLLQFSNFIGTFIKTCRRFKFESYFKISIFSHFLRLDLVSAAVSQAYTNSPIFLEEGMLLQFSNFIGTFIKPCRRSSSKIILKFQFLATFWRLDLVSAAVSQAYTNSPIFLEEGMRLHFSNFIGPFIKPCHRSS